MADNLSTVSPAGNQGTPTGTGTFYATISAFESGEAQTIPLGDTVTCECYAGNYGGPNGGLDDGVNWSSWGTTPTDKIIVRAAPGSENNGIRVIDGGTGFYWVTTAGRNIASNTTQNIDFVDLELASLSTSGCVLISTADPGTNYNFFNIIMTADSISGTAYCFDENAGGDVDSMLLDNCIIYTSGRGFRSNNTTNGAAKILNNCTIVADTRGLVGASDLSPTCKNTVVVAIGENAYYSSNSPGALNNAGSGTTAPAGGVPVNNIVLTTGVDFVDYATGDMRPVDTGALTGAGTNPSLLALDIAGNTRANPDAIGAFALAVAPAGAVLDTPTVVSITQTTATIGCSTDTAGGTLYWYVSLSATPPSPADLKAGTGSVDFGNLVPTNGANTAGATGLTQNTQYWHYWIQVTA